MTGKPSSPIGPLINRARAEAILDRFGVSALVLGETVNIYHATGFWPQTLEMGHLGSSLAVVPRDRTLPVTLVTTQFLHYFYDLGRPNLALRLYTAPHGDDRTEAAPPTFFVPARDGTSDRFEREARAGTLAALAEVPAAPNAMAALEAALGDLGAGAPLAVDGSVARQMVGEHNRPIEAEPLLRRIRMIKSPAEITLMRHAAQSNAAAARAAVAQMQPGNRYADLRNAFFAETGLRGGRPSFMAIDSRAAEHRDGVIREGRSIQMDAVASYEHYHGDFGRTILVGHPHPALRRALDGAVRANRAIAAALSPGIRYSDIMRIGREAAGPDAPLPASPHSVGLFHTDEAFEGDGLCFAKADHLIEKDMVLSVDCPALVTGMGGTVHLEDLWLITETGCEPLNDPGEPWLTIGDGGGEA